MKLAVTLVFGMYCALLWGQTGSIKGTIAFDGKSFEGLKDDILISLIGKKTLEKGSWGTEIDFSSVPADTFSIRVYDLMCLDTTIENIIVSANQTTELHITILSTCKYDKTARNKECPVCHKTDETIPIVYGLLVSAGKSKKRKKKETFYSGGCEVTCCDPNWYCRRDEITF